MNRKLQLLTGWWVETLALHHENLSCHGSCALRSNPREWGRCHTVFQDYSSSLPEAPRDFTMPSSNWAHLPLPAAHRGECPTLREPIQSLTFPELQAPTNPCRSGNRHDSRKPGFLGTALEKTDRHVLILPILCDKLSQALTSVCLRSLWAEDLPCRSRFWSPAPPRSP